MIRKSISVLLIAVMMFSSFAFAEEKTELTIDMAVEMATKDKSSITKMDDTIESLWKSYRSALGGRNQITEMMDVNARFKILYDKEQNDETLTAEESQTLRLYKMTLGSEPQEYSSDQMYSFVKTKELLPASLYAEIQKLKNTQKTIEPSTEMGVRTLYNQVVGLQSTIDQQKLYYDINVEKHEALVTKNKLGQVSDHDLKVSELNLEVQKLQLVQLERNLDSLEYNLNQLMDAVITDKYILVDPVDSLENIFTAEAMHKTLDEYLDLAIQNRSEVKNARLDYNVKKNENDTIKMYIKQELLTNRMEAEIAFIKAENALESAEKTVKDNIADGYIDVMSKWNDYQLSIDAYKIKENSYNEMKSRYDLGQVTQTDLKLVEFQKIMASDTVKSNLRNYLNAIEKMDKATGIGPAY